MKRTRTTTTDVIVSVCTTQSDDSLEFKDAVTAMETASALPAGSEDNLDDTVVHLRAELRRKDKELQRKDEDLRVAQVNFAELDICSREVEQELESEILRLSRLNRELENENRTLERRWKNEFCRIAHHSSVHDDVVGQLQQKLQRLEQTNDDLEMCVRRVESTNEDLSSELESAQEECIFAQQELESFKDEAKTAMQSINQIHSLKVYETLVGYLLTTSTPYETVGTELVKEIVKEAHEQDPLSSDTDDTEEESNEDYDVDYIVSYLA